MGACPGTPAVGVRKWVSVPHGPIAAPLKGVGAGYISQWRENQLCSWRHDGVKVTPRALSRG